MPSTFSPASATSNHGSSASSASPARFLRKAEAPPVRHFAFLAEEDLCDLFAVPPRHFDRRSPPDVLRCALGATLYSPGTRLTLALDARRAAQIGATSQVWCLEDSIANDEVTMA